jgi:hypothetical protein
MGINTSLSRIPVFKWSCIILFSCMDGWRWVELHDLHRGTAVRKFTVGPLAQWKLEKGKLHPVAKFHEKYVPACNIDISVIVYRTLSQRGQGGRWM